MGTCERVESERTRGTFHSPSFHINTSPKFHVANIQRLLTKKELKEKGIIIKEIEKIKFLREMCKEEKPYFLAFAETWLNDKIKEAEYEIEGYSHVASHRKDREGGGVIIYIENGATYRPLVHSGALLWNNMTFSKKIHIILIYVLILANEASQYSPRCALSTIIFITLNWSN